MLSTEPLEELRSAFAGIPEGECSIRLEVPDKEWRAGFFGTPVVVRFWSNLTRTEAQIDFDLSQRNPNFRVSAVAWEESGCCRILRHNIRPIRASSWTEALECGVQAVTVCFEQESGCHRLYA